MKRFLHYINMAAVITLIVGACCMDSENQILPLSMIGVGAVVSLIAFLIRRKIA